MIERRRHRSNIPHEAVSLLLGAAAARSGARAAALGDPDGLLLGGAGAGDLGQFAALAALGALGARRSDDARRGAGPADVVEDSSEALGGGEDVYTSRIPLGERVYHLISVGARVRRQRELAAGLARILGPCIA
ncbi:MAG TPA: hypothetical protein VLS89_12315 [Candidatus Nanopelagicales bacterium]|nr:hypothetical protein [Candidatus Nanopelagicales bacterium]